MIERATKAAGALAMLAALAGASSAAESGERVPADAAATRATMASILDALRTALPLAASPTRFAAPAHREALERSFDTLASSGRTLAEHAAGHEPGFEHLGRYFASRTATIKQRFARGEVDESRFLLWMLAESCINCHERLPSPDSRIGSRLVEQTTLADLPPVERVRFEIATRQFTQALDTYEGVFRDPAVPPTTLDVGGHLTDYLLVAVRVVDDPARAKRGLTILTTRADASRYLQSQLRAWIAALERLETRPAAASPIDDARALLDEAARRARYPADRRVLVEAVAASARLHRWVAAHPGASPKTAEAYYLLGRAEGVIRRSYGASQADFYLETAIRMAPESPFADDAYDMLEEQTVAAWEGSAGTPMPADVRARLDGLRRLVGER